MSFSDRRPPKFQTTLDMSLGSRDNYYGGVYPDNGQFNQICSLTGRSAAQLCANSFRPMSDIWKSEGFGEVQSPSASSGYWSFSTPSPIASEPALTPFDPVLNAFAAYEIQNQGFEDDDISLDFAGNGQHVPIDPNSTPAYVPWSVSTYPVRRPFPTPMTSGFWSSLFSPSVPVFGPQLIEQEVSQRQPSSASFSAAAAADSEVAYSRPIENGFNYRTNRKRTPSCVECVFCKNNGEKEIIYKGHVLKDLQGRIVCPVLRAYTCPICQNKGGDEAHTVRYCPKNRPSVWQKLNSMKI